MEKISSLEDARLDPYRQIRNRSWIERSGIFVAEGPLVVDALLKSAYECQSLLLDERFLERFDGAFSEDLPVLCLSRELMEDLVGFQFHRGVMGCGKRRPALSVQSALGNLSSGELLVCLVGVQDPENLGGIIRNCAALGVRAVLVGPRCSDPFSRRALRVAMGTTLNVEIVSCPKVEDDLEWLQRACGARVFVSSLDSQALELCQIRSNGPDVIVFGNERNGLPSSVMELADHRVRIPMHHGVDSLNVCVATGIFIHAFQSRH